MAIELIQLKEIQTMKFQEKVIQRKK